MTSHERTTQVRISKQTAAALRNIAASFGFYQSRGSGAHSVGNIADMLDAVATGDFEVVRSSVRSERNERSKKRTKGGESA